MNCFFSVKSWCTCMYNTLGASFTLVFANEAKHSHRVKEHTDSLKSYQRLPLSGYLFFFIVVPVERGVGAHCDDKLLLSSCLQTFLLNFKGCNHDELIADWMLWGEST